jgi:hypothetical protein
MLRKFKQIHVGYKTKDRVDFLFLEYVFVI